MIELIAATLIISVALLALIGAYSFGYFAIGSAGQKLGRGPDREQPARALHSRSRTPRSPSTRRRLTSVKASDANVQHGRERPSRERHGCDDQRLRIVLPVLSRCRPSPAPTTSRTRSRRSSGFSPTRATRPGRRRSSPSSSGTRASRLAEGLDDADGLRLGPVVSSARSLPRSRLVRARDRQRGRGRDLHGLDDPWMPTRRKHRCPSWRLSARPRA